MTQLFYAGRHRAPQQSSTTRKAGLGVAAAAAFGLAAPAALTTGSASAATTSTSAASVTSTAAAASGTSTTSAFSRLVGYGDRGSTVRRIQGVVGTTADGIFGPVTLAAVKRYQRNHGLAVDGIVGPRTGSAMGLTDSAPRAPRAGTRGATTGGSSLLSAAAGLIGTPYRWGGTTPRGFDCSGFTQYVFARAGASLPRTAEQQRRAATRVSSPRPGDLVFFGAPAWHVGIYAGNGQMYDSGSSGSTVTKRAIWTSNVTYGRV